MSKLQDLFEKDIYRNIETVVKADDEKELLQELKEYVFTNEISNMFADQDIFSLYMKP